jgi:hypothetical protein
MGARASTDGPGLTDVSNCHAGDAADRTGRLSWQDYMPDHGLPRGDYPPGSYYWADSDGEYTYHPQGHEEYGPTDIVYRFNSRGFRCNEFDSPGDVRLLAVGCSCTLGVGLAAEHVYVDIFARRIESELGLSVVVANISRGGASADYVCRNVALVVPRLRPDITLVLFPAASRREYVGADMTRWDYFPGRIAGPKPPPEILAMDALSNEWDDTLNMFRNYKAVEAALRGQIWLFSFTNPDYVVRPFLAPLLNDRHWVSAHRGERIDFARDGIHPGRRTNERIADLFWDKFVETGQLAALKSRADNRRRGVGLDRPHAL